MVVHMDKTYTNHILTQAMNKGSCGFLKGRTLFCFVYVDHKGMKWSRNKRSSQEKRRISVLQRLEKEARSEGIYLCCLQREFQMTVNAPNSDADTKDWPALLAKQYQFNAPEDMYEVLLANNRAEQAAFVFMTQAKGRSFAVSCGDIEYDVLYGEEAMAEGVITHELLHIFGAKDLYYHEKVVSCAEKLFPKSVMISGRTEGWVIDDLTRYLIGWHQSPSPTAQAFLDETSSIGSAEYRTARKSISESDHTVLYFDDGYYEGPLRDSKPNGHGKLVFDHGDVYIGEFLDGNMHGQGEYRWPGGTRYIGSFQNNKQTGCGKIIWASGGSWAGLFINGHPQWDTEVSVE